MNLGWFVLTCVELEDEIKVGTPDALDILPISTGKTCSARPDDGGGTLSEPAVGDPTNPSARVPD